MIRALVNSRIVKLGQVITPIMMSALAGSKSRCQNGFDKRDEGAVTFLRRCRHRHLATSE